MASPDNTVMMEGVTLVFRNFTGKEGQYNREGDRNFGVLLDRETAVAMEADGWNVKLLKPREDDEDGEPQPWLPVAVGLNGKHTPPKIFLITSRGRTALDEDTVAQLDWVDIQNVDLIVRPYHWDIQGKSGVKAYLKTMFVTIDEDELEQKYAEMDAQ